MSFIIKYRLHIIAVSFLLVLHSLNRSLGRLSADAIIVSFSVACVIGYVYLFNKTTDTEEDARSEKGEDIAPQTVHPTYVASLIFAALPLCWLWLYPAALAMFIAMASAGFLYSSRRVPGIRVKNVFLLKNVWAAFFWAIPAGISPATLRGSVSSLDVVHLVFIFLIALMIEIFWDMRDAEGDRQARIPTIPNRYGFPFTKVLITVLGVIAAMFAAANLFPWVAYPGIALLVLSAVFATDKRPASYYHVMIFVWIMVLAGELLCHDSTRM